MPRPGTPVIHPGLRDRLADVLDSTHLSTCTLARPATRTFDPTSGTYSTAGAPYWTGLCRIQARSRSQGTVTPAGGEDTTHLDYQVTLPLTVPHDVRVDDQLHILASPNAQVAGLTLRVTEIVASDLHGEQHLTCQDARTADGSTP